MGLTTDFTLVDGWWTFPTHGAETGHVRPQKSLQMAMSGCPTPTEPLSVLVRVLRVADGPTKVASEQVFSSRRPDSNRGPLHYESSASDRRILRFACKFESRAKSPSP
jgi:hypothetical protein